MYVKKRKVIKDNYIYKYIFLSTVHKIILKKYLNKYMYFTNRFELWFSSHFIFHRGKLESPTVLITS